MNRIEQHVGRVNQPEIPLERLVGHEANAFDHVRERDPHAIVKLACRMPLTVLGNDEHAVRIAPQDVTEQPVEVGMELLDFVADKRKDVRALSDAEVGRIPATNWQAKPSAAARSRATSERISRSV